MSYRQYNRIPVPEVQRDEKKPLSQLRDELSFVNGGVDASDKEKPRSAARPKSIVVPKTGEKRRSSSVVQSSEKRVNQKIHPGYEKPYDADRQRRLEERKRAEYIHRKQLAEKRRRAEKARQKELAASKRLKREAKRERELENKKMLYRKQQRRRLNAERNKRYSHELSVEENARIRIKKEREKKRRMEKARLFAVRAAASVVLGILLFSFGFAMHIFSLNRYAAYSLSVYVRVGENERYKAEKGNIFILGEQISQLCDFTALENENGVKYISSASGNEYITFTFDVPSATVNGNKVRIEASPYIKNGKIYVPLSFFEEYCSGLNILYDEKSNTVGVSRQITNEKAVASNGAAPIYEPVTFTLKENGTLTRIDERLVP